MAAFCASRQTFSAVAGMVMVVVAERVGDGVDHRRRRADGARLAAALHAERIARAGVSVVETWKDGRSSARGMA